MRARTLFIFSGFVDLCAIRLHCLAPIPCGYYHPYTEATLHVYALSIGPDRVVEREYQTNCGQAFGVHSSDDIRAPLSRH